MQVPTLSVPNLSVVRELDSAIDFEIPPIARCNACHRFDCDGCVAASASPTLPWERDQGSTWSRLWSTAKRSVCAATESCLDVATPRPLRALSFAFAAELLASLSLGALLVTVAFMLFPMESASLLGSRGALLALGSLGVGLAVFLVLVHLLWGFGLELGLWLVGCGFQLRRGLSFALYASGWDLFTSPIGIFVSVAGSGFGEGFGRVKAAARIPRDAVLRYITVDRSATVSQGNFVALFSFVLPVALTLLLAGSVAVLWVADSLRVILA